MNKKGQAGIEFLMEWGWAILIVLACIGALAYFGVLSPDSFKEEGLSNDVKESKCIEEWSHHFNYIRDNNTGKFIISSESIYAVNDCGDPRAILDLSDSVRENRCRG